MSPRTRVDLARLLATALLAASLGAPAGALPRTGAEPRFHIQAIEVRGAKHVSPAIIASESLLEAGQVYTESELGEAVDRIRRLPFILDVGFALGKGSERGTYVLLVDVRETRRFFYLIDLKQAWFGVPLAFESGDELGTNLTNTATAGARLFLGRYGMLFAAAGTEGARFGFTRYNLFRSNAVLSLGVSSDTCCPTAVAPLGLDPAYSAWIDGEGAKSAAVSLGVPLGARQSVRGSLALRESQRGFRRPVLGRLVRDETVDGEPVLGDRVEDDFIDFRDRREQELRLTWQYDTTDDPVFPSTGTALAVALDYRTLDAELAPARGSTVETSSELLRLSVLGERHWPFARRHSFAAGLTLAVGRGRFDNLPVAGDVVAGDLTSWALTATIRHSARLVEPKRAHRFREVYWQNVLEYSVDSTSPQIVAALRPLEVATVSSALVFRNDWGIVRFGLRWIDVGEVL